MFGVAFAAAVLWPFAAGAQSANTAPWNGVPEFHPVQPLTPDFLKHATPAAIHAGKLEYEIHCSTCHGVGMEGTKGVPELETISVQGLDFMLRTGRMPAWLIGVQPMRQNRPQLPRWEQVELMDYVMSKSSGNKTLPHVDLSHVDLEHGRAVWAENCEQCHAATAEGNSVNYQDVAPQLMDDDPQTIADAVRYGPDVMPKFGKGIISQSDLNDLVAYIHWLQTAQYNPGGLRLDNWGPISEGFVAWTFGISLLVLLARRIGTTE